MRKADNFDAKQWLVENKITTQSRLNEENQSHKIISKKTEKSKFGDEIYDDYEINVKDEPYTTTNGLTFHLKTIGYVSIPEGDELDFDKPSHYFYYIQTLVSDENGNQLEKIPGEKNYGVYNVARSINKVKKWLDKSGSQLISGKGFQHKST